MSFIDDSEKNVDRIIKEESVAGFVGGAGMGIDKLFAGPFHPDSGHGSQNEKLHKKRLEDRKKQRQNLETDRDGVIDDYSGIPDPIGGYYDTDTEFVSLAYEELDLFNKVAKEFNIKNTPPIDIEWKSTGWNYDYDEPGEAYKIKDIKYDDNSNLYADDTYINKSETNWKYIEGK